MDDDKQAAVMQHLATRIHELEKERAGIERELDRNNSAIKELNRMLNALKVILKLDKRD